ncbi:MAG: serine/threonine protein kinase, partial [Myxococcales bacterium]|nr:serine/threonine protein kinase [Myxococcales bacterium]
GAVRSSPAMAREVSAVAGGEGPGLVDRLRLAGGLFALGFVAVYVARPRVGAPAGLDTALLAGLVSAVVVAGLVAVLAPRLDDPQRVVELGLGFEILACLIVALAEHWPPWPAEPVVRGVSWACLVLVVFPWVVPTRPRVTLVTSLVAASASPLALYLSALRGNPIPPVQAQAALLLPPYLCAGGAYLLARRLWRLGRKKGDPERMGAFDLIELLGKGGMGEVWRATHHRLARPAAVKLVRPQVVSKQIGEDPHVVFRRFEREARATAALTSAHTVSVFDYGYTPDGAFYYAMELLDGIDLETLVERHGPQPPERVAAILVQVCDSLAEAHEAGLVHRDIKPANIYVCTLGRTPDFVKVLDFGLVMSTEDAETRLTRLTNEGLATGTPAYMAPEMATRGQIDARADLYSLGCVAYFLLTGAEIFDDPNPIQIMLGQIERPPIPMRQRYPGLKLSPEFEAILGRMLEKNRDARFPDAGALADALRGCRLPEPWGPSEAAAWWSRVEHRRPAPRPKPQLETEEGPLPTGERRLLRSLRRPAGE